MLQAHTEDKFSLGSQMVRGSTQRFDFGDLTLDLGRRQLFRGDEPIHLTKLSFQLLRALVTAAPNLLPRESLAAEVWGPNRVVTPENVSQRIMALRRQLGDPATEPRYVEGIRGEGYRLIPAVKANTAVAHIPDAADAAPARISRPRLPNSVAVLPFENLTPDPKNAYFALGVHAEIVKHLSRLRNVNTISRTTMHGYADSSLSVSEIAAELGVETILEGSVRYQGDRVRISVNLIEPELESSLWSETYERDLVDVFEIETDIAAHVAEALRVELLRGEPRRVPLRPAVPTQAYALYMQALGLFATNSIGKQMGKLLERALDLEPRFPEAYGLSAYRCAMSYIDMMNQDVFDDAYRSRLEVIVRDHAQRALDLDPNVAIAHAAAGLMDLTTWRWTEACRRFSLAHELGWTWDISPFLYSWMGRHDEAIARARRVLELGPNDMFRHRHLGIALAYAREHEDALAMLNNALAMAPADPVTTCWVLYVQIAQRMHAEAAQTAVALERILGDNRPAILLAEIAYAYHRLGLQSDARRIVDEINVIAEQKTLGAGVQAMAHLAIGDDASALHWLHQAVDKIRRREPKPSAINLLNLKMNFLIDPRLEEPDFRRALNAIHGD